MARKSPWQEWKDAMGDVRPWDFMNGGERATDEEQNRRFTICLECPLLSPVTHQCSKCKCFMKYKTALQEATCPIGKW